MTGPNRRPNDGLLRLLTLLAVVVVAFLAWWPLVLIAHLHGRHVPLNPAALMIALAGHHTPWPGAGVVIVYVAEVLAAVVAAVFVLRARRRRGKGRTRADSATGHLSGPAEMVGLTPSEVRASALRLRPGVNEHDVTQHGVLLAETLLSRTPLRMGWEDIAVVLAGPRVGKTTSNVVPAIVDYRGPVKTSSNKPDSHDATRQARASLGTVWVCDPQTLVGSVASDPSRRSVGHMVGHAAGHAAGQEARRGGDRPNAQLPAFWFDPLADVDSLAVARELVQILIDSTVDADAKPDAYFHPTGKATLVNYVYAAALAGRTLLEVDGWLADPQDSEAIGILSSRGFAAAAQQLSSVLAKPDKQRDGVLGTAQSWLAAITDPRYANWVIPPSEADRERVPRFDPDAFVRSCADTLYLLSQEGPASAAFVTTALNAAVDRAAIAYARTLPGRRLEPPLLSILDEAANTIRDTTLPDKVSHYGSRGLPTLIVLQSWSQGVQVWGERGMRKLWSAANIKLYLGGVAETEFLKSLCDLLGERDDRYWVRSSSRAGYGSGGSSISTAEQIRRVPIMSIAELAALPRGRALLFSSGNRPTLGRPVPWMSGPHAEQIRASLAAWESDDDHLRRLAETDRAIAETGDTDRSDRLLHDHELSSSLTNEGVLL